MARLRVGIAGARRGASLASVFALMPDCEIAAACDPDASRLEEFGIRFPGAALYSDYPDMLETGLDIAVIASPVPMHCVQTVAALEAGCHVLQEVTLGQTLEECRDILGAVLVHPRQKFMLAENCCYWAHILSWKGMYAQGLLGEFLYAEAEYIHDVRSLMRAEDGSLTWRASLPPIHYCTHSLGPLLWVTGDRCVTACGLAGPSRLEPDMSSPDMEVGIFSTASGGVVKILAGFRVVREPSFHYYSIYGTRGCLETVRPPKPLATVSYLSQVPHLQNMIEMPLGYSMPGASRDAERGGHGTAERDMVAAFLRSIWSDTDPPIDIYRALDMAVPGLCAHESALQGGKPVDVPAWR